MISKRQIALSSVVMGICVIGKGHAMPEGTAQLGIVQAVDSQTIIGVDIVAPGEVIHVCTSDDGLTEAPVGEFPVDAGDGGEEHTFRAQTRRLRQEILAYPPDSFECLVGADCPMGQVCVNRRYGLPIENVPDGPVGDPQRCAIPFAVSPTTDPSQGLCTASIPAENPILIIADRVGVWEFDLLGEPSTLPPIDGTSSTRFFQFDIHSAAGESVPGGRIHSRQWLINTHSLLHSGSATFYALRRVADEAITWAMSYDNWQGGTYSILANSMGVENHQDQSWCYVTHPDGVTCDRRGPGAAPELVYNEFLLYLNFPDQAPQEPAAVTIEDLTFNDSVGTATLTPDGDNDQDTGRFAFVTPVPGVYRIWIDIDQDGLFNPLTEIVQRADARAGRNSFDWDGTGPDGVVLPEGEYAFQVTVDLAEIHFPIIGVEYNLTGLSIRRAAGAPLDGAPPVQLNWNDDAVRSADALVDESDAIIHRTDLVPGPENLQTIRRWQQPGFPEERIPIVFDTWVTADRATAATATCRRCESPVDVIRIGEINEPPDPDEDGLATGEEDINGNGEVDEGETDPNNPDTDGDGLGDGVESRGSTDPLNPDTDGDGIPDGIEDANGNGVVDDGETDPTNPDSDGDGIPDGDDELPLSPNRPDGPMEVDAGEMVMMPPVLTDAGAPPPPTADGGVEDGTKLLEFDKLGCACNTQGGRSIPAGSIFVLLCLAWFQPKRRHRAK